MKKVIKEDYGMDVDKIIKTNSNYIFTYNKEKYLFYKCFNNFNMEEIIKITSYLYSKNIPMHIFIKNKNNDFITSKDNSTYILMKVICKEKVTYDDIINFNFIYSNGKCKWKELWSYKNDFYMKQFSEYQNKYKELKYGFNYYLSLSEIGISLLNTIDTDMPLYITHKRFNLNGIDFYNPFNITIDLVSREISEYIKYIFYNDKNYKYKITDYLGNILKDLTNNEKIYLFIRMFYNTIFFDKYESIIENNLSDNEIIEITKKTKEYQNLLLFMYYQISFYVKLKEISFLTIQH